MYSQHINCDSVPLTIHTCFFSKSAVANGDYPMLVNEPLLTIPSSATNGQSLDVIIQVNGDLAREDSELFFVTFAGQNPNDGFPAGFNPRLRVIINDDGDGMCV